MKTPFALFALLPLGVGFLAPACADDAQCDDGQKVMDGNCVADTPSGSGGAGGGGDAATGGGDSGATCEGPAIEFGTPCTDDVTHAECGCPARTCAIQPSTPGEGICTLLGCKEDPSLCPTGWTCLDLTAIPAAGISVCIEQQ